MLYPEGRLEQSFLTWFWPSLTSSGRRCDEFQNDGRQSCFANGKGGGSGPSCGTTTSGLSKVGSSSGEQHMPSIFSMATSLSIWFTRGGGGEHSPQVTVG